MASPAAEARPLGSRLEAMVAVVLVAVLVGTRVRMVAVFGGQWTDEDQALLWYAVRDLAGGHLREPYFFGQTYGSWLEALLAVPVAAVGIPIRLALPAASSALGTLPWLASRRWRGGDGGPRSSPSACSRSPWAWRSRGSPSRRCHAGCCPGSWPGSWPSSACCGWPRATVAVAVFGFVLVVSASWNVGAGLVTGPVAVHLVLSSPWRRDRRWMGALAGGIGAGVAVHVGWQAFYRARPAYDVHGSPAFAFSWDRMVENLGHLARYVPAYAPEAARWWGLPVFALVGVGGWVVWSRRTVAATAAVAVALTMAVAVLGTAKANDGHPSIFFPYSRVYLALPWLVCVLAALSRRSDGPDSVQLGVRRRPTVAWTSAAVALALLALASAAVREVRLDHRARALVAMAADVPPVVPVSTRVLLDRCTLRRREQTRN